MSLQTETFMAKLLWNDDELGLFPLVKILQVP